MAERRHDYVPINAAQFHVFMTNLIGYVTEKTTSVPVQWTTESFAKQNSKLTIGRDVDC